jgi:hypothetical protein
MAKSSIGAQERARRDPQHGIDPEARVNPHRYAKGDVCVHTTKPGPGRVAGKRIRTVNPLEAAHERGKLSTRQLEASRKVEALVTRCSIAGGHSRDSTRMGEPRGREQSDESAERQAAAMQTLRKFTGQLDPTTGRHDPKTALMDPKTWFIVRDVCMGARVIADWRETYDEVKRLRRGLDIAASYWRIPAYGAEAADKT